MNRGLLAFALALVAGVSSAADEPDYSAELPRIPATEATAAIKTFAVRPPFAMTLAASEPEVASPVAMAFDADGRLYVVEMRDYSEQDKEHLGVVRRLEDADGDGRFETSVVFAGGLSWPTAVTCWDGGVFVGAPPDLYYLKDTDGDGAADIRRTVFTGFSRANVQGMMNSLRWGPDRRIHGAGSSVGGTITSPERPEMKPVKLGRHDFSFDPRTLDFRITTASAQHGLCFDDWGHKFVCSNSDHIQQVMYEDADVARNPYLSAPGGAASIAADGPQAAVYRTSPVEPWRIVRTRLRVAGTVPGPVEFGGKVSGYFSSATGVTVYRGDAWPAEWHGCAIVGDVGSNLIHRKRLLTQELPFVAKRADVGTEFVTSADTWFRPVQFENGPDGSLYVADFYRETIEHPASLPESIKKHLDLTSGRDRGRIWRLAPADFKPRIVPALNIASTAELAALLAHPNAWHRETASRLIDERRDRSAIPLLKELAAAHTTAPPEWPGARGREIAALGRIHALRSLEGLGALETDEIAAALIDSYARVREATIKLARPRLATDARLRELVLRLVGDESKWVRYEAAFALGDLVVPAADRGDRPAVPAAISGTAVAAIDRVLRRGFDDLWFRVACLSGLTGREADVLSVWLRDETPCVLNPETTRELAAIVARRGKPDEIAAVADALETQAKSKGTDAVLATWFASPTPAVRAVLNVPARPALRETVARRLSEAKSAAADPQRPIPERLGALRTVRLAPFAEAADLFEDLTGGRQPPEVQAAAVELLRGYDDPTVADRLVAAWPRLGPGVRGVVADALVSTAATAAGLLDAIDAGRFDAAALPEAARRLLSEHPDALVRDRAAKTLAGEATGARAEIVADYRPALDLNGDPGRGRPLFIKHCAACHKFGDAGHEVGPNLTAIKARGSEFILLNLLDPSREVNPQYVDYVVLRTDGRIRTGLIAAESPTAVTLKRAEAATETVLRLDIEDLRGTGRSLMPDGFEKQLERQAIADLIAFLMARE